MHKRIFWNSENYGGDGEKNTEVGKWRTRVSERWEGREEKVNGVREDKKGGEETKWSLGSEDPLLQSTIL